MYWNRLPREAVESLLWSYSKPAWTKSCVACSRWSCFGRGVGLDDPQTSIPIPTILWFCDSVILCADLLNLSRGIRDREVEWPIPVKTELSLQGPGKSAFWSLYVLIVGYEWWESSPNQQLSSAKRAMRESFTEGSKWYLYRRVNTGCLALLCSISFLSHPHGYYQRHDLRSSPEWSL